MARFVTFFSYTPEAWARLLDKPGDRSGPVGATIAEAGGRLESIDYLSASATGWQCSRLLTLQPLPR
jgi:hypothetical protein